MTIRSTSLLAAITAIICAGAIDKSQATEPCMTPATRIESAFSFVDTLQRLRAALQSNGFIIFAVIDQRAAAESVGLEMPPTTLILYGNPKGGTSLMLAAPDFGVELPLKVLVREGADARTVVVYNPATALEGKHGLPVGMATKLGAGEPLIAAAVGVRL